jgi:hypothetical protein
VVNVKKQLADVKSSVSTRDRRLDALTNRQTRTINLLGRFGEKLYRISGLGRASAAAFARDEADAALSNAVFDDFPAPWEQILPSVDNAIFDGQTHKDLCVYVGASPTRQAIAPAGLQDGSVGWDGLWGAFRKGKSH